MPLVNRYGTQLSHDALAVLQNILHGSLDNRIKRFENYFSRCPDRERQEVLRYFIRVHRYYLERLPKSICYWDGLPNNYTISQWISQLNNAISNDLARYGKSLMFYPGAYSMFCSLLKCNSGDPALLAAFKIPIPCKDMPESYEQTIRQLKFSSQPFPGVETLGGYTIQWDDLRHLYCSDSNPLVRTIKVYNQKQFIEPWNQADCQNKIHDAKVCINVQLRIVQCALRGAPVLTQKMRKGELLTFADLYPMLSNFNAAGRTNEQGAGNLCGGNVFIRGGGLEGIAPSVAPKAMIDTLDIVARCMNQILRNRVASPALKKTWVIQLAAFAEAMVVSMQAFEDGNKRSARMLRDLILMSFGLPPCLPSCSSTFPPTIGTPDAGFDQRAWDTMESMKQTDDALKVRKGLRWPSKQAQARNFAVPPISAAPPAVPKTPANFYYARC